MAVDREDAAHEHGRGDEEQRQLDRLPAAKAAILAALKATRAANVTIEYDGEGDSGQITGITAMTARGKAAKLPKGPFSLQLYDAQSSYVSFEDALDAFAWTVLRVYHGGFENNDGGFGTLTINVAEETITLDHNDRIIDLCNSVAEV
jgi:hypothetical protein